MSTTESAASGLFTARDTRNIQVFQGWMLGAAVTFIAATILIGEKYLEPGPLAWGIAITAMLLTAMSLRAYIHFLRHADELLRKIQLDALAAAFAAGIFFMMGYRLCERLGAPKLDINDPVGVMLLFWAVWQWRGVRRYTAGGES